MRIYFIYFIWTNLNPLLPRMICAMFGWNWPNGSGKEDFLISSMYFIYFIIILLGEGRGPSLEQTWIPITQGCFVPSLVEIGQDVLEKKMKMWKVYRRTDRLTEWFLCTSLNFIQGGYKYNKIFFLWNILWSFILTNLNSLYPGMLYSKFIWNQQVFF